MDLIRTVTLHNEKLYITTEPLGQLSSILIDYLRLLFICSNVFIMTVISLTKETNASL